MSTDQKASSGSDHGSGGAAEKTQENKQDASKEIFSLEEKQRLLEHNKTLLAEKKKIQERADELERKEKEREEAKLKQEGDYKKLLEQRDAELQDEKTKRTQLEAWLADNRKMSAFRKALSGELPEQYLGLVDLDNIAVDPETGKPDEASVKAAATSFESRYSEVIKRVTKGRLPDDMAKGKEKLTYKKWLELPYEEKIKRQGDVALD